MIVKIYNGYGHMNSLVLYGHVLSRPVHSSKKLTNNFLVNTANMVRLFFVKPLPGVSLRLRWRSQVLETLSEADGFFKFEWASDTPTPAGWHPLVVEAVHNGAVIATADGQVFVPHATQFGFISDIDDTLLVSHSATVVKRLRVLFAHNAHTRRAFKDAVAHYTLLSHAFTTPDVPNPFFYVSSSEWNLYDYLAEFFSFNKFPAGIFLLSQIKRWYNLVKTGKTKHHTKTLRIARVLHMFPLQQFILMGDNSQHDPDIYQSIANEYAGKIYAVYIRNVRPEKAAATQALLDALQQSGVHTCFYTNSSEAIAHSKKIGLIR